MGMLKATLSAPQKVGESYQIINILLLSWTFMEEFIFFKMTMLIITLK